jgi:hypothetical protein
LEGHRPSKIFFFASHGHECGRDGRKSRNMGG